MACAIELNEFLNCEICFELFDEPQSLTCRHVFCRKCVNRIKNGTKIKCPVCNVQCKVIDIKPDFRTVAMVDAYRKNLTKEPSPSETEDDLISKCEVCKDDGAKVSHKCETCDLLLCENCEALHVASSSNGGCHTTKAISAIAGDMRTEINRTLTDLKAEKEVLSAKLSCRQKELDDMRHMTDTALKSIAEKEENLIVKIKSHHDSLRKEVETEIAKHVKKGKQECKSTEISYHDVKDKEVLLNSWVSNRSNLSIANIKEQIKKKLQDIEKESSKKQIHGMLSKEHGTSAANLTVRVIEGIEYDPNTSTKIMFSTNQSADGKYGAIGTDNSQAEEVSGSRLFSDYTLLAEYRDYKVDKTVIIDYANSFNKKIENIQQFNGHLYCMAEEMMHVYTEDLVHVKTINPDRNNYVACRAFTCVNDKHLITASSRMGRGLKVLDTEGKELQKICRGEFYGLAVHDDKLYAYEYNINKVLIFEQTQDNSWKKSGEIYLSYKGTTPHKVKAITSFKMENEQIYISDNTSIYHLDIHGKLKRRINQGSDTMAFKNPRICSVDSKGNLLVVEPGNRKLIVVRADGKCDRMMLRGEEFNNIHFALIDAEKECVWVAHYEPRKDESYLTKYTSTRIQEAII